MSNQPPQNGLARAAIIVAGGTGTRMNSEIPKQFLEIAGWPVLMHTLNAFHTFDHALKIVVVLPAAEIDAWQHLIKSYQFKVTHELTTGGATRFESVKNGLQKIPDQGLVAIHDGVRPLVTPAIIATSFEVAAQFGSAVAAVSLKESIRQVKAGKTFALDRSAYRLIQTPQTFDTALLKKAYEIPYDDTLTDDASVFEKAGHQIKLFEGSYENIKITTPEDLLTASMLLQGRL